VFLIVQAAMYAWNGRELPDEVRARLARLLGVFVAASLYLVAVYHMTNLYFERQQAFESFILLGRGGDAVFPLLFWLGYVGLGSLLPLGMLFHPRARTTRGLLGAAALVVAGAFAWLYVFIIGGQAFPLEIFPGYEVTSSFRDGAIAAYAPSLPEVLLGVGGVAAAFVITLVGVQVLDIVPADPAAR
jgi:molybdopterin-containing oxidoreductase family membrane subunit